MESSGTITSTEKAEPVWRWQLSQWQTEVLIGSASLVYSIEPQRQRPLIFEFVQLLELKLGPGPFSNVGLRKET